MADEGVRSHPASVLRGAFLVFGVRQSTGGCLSFVQNEMDIPTHWARVTDAFWPKDHMLILLQPDYILIQDVHRNPDVQTQITALIMHGYRRWGVRKVFMEGAFVLLDLSLFHRIPKQILPEVVRRQVHGRRSFRAGSGRCPDSGNGVGKVLCVLFFSALWFGRS